MSDTVTVTRAMALRVNPLLVALSTDAVDDWTDVPCAHSPNGRDSVFYIRHVLETYYSDDVNLSTLAHVWIETQRKLACATVHLKAQSGNGLQWLTIWYDAPPYLVGGGRSVESGHGANYYSTVGELRDAVRNALRQIRGEPDE